MGMCEPLGGRTRFSVNLPRSIRVVSGGEAQGIPGLSHRKPQWRAPQAEIPGSVPLSLEKIKRLAKATKSVTTGSSPT